MTESSLGAGSVVMRPTLYLNPSCSESIRLYDWWFLSTVFPSTARLMRPWGEEEEAEREAPTREEWGDRAQISLRVGHRGRG